MGEFHIIIDPNGNINRLKNPAVWKAYERKLVKAITEAGKELIQETAESMFKNPTGAMANAWSTAFDEGTNIGYIKNSKSYAYFLNKGVKRQQMTWLLKVGTRQYTAFSKAWKHYGPLAGGAPTTFWARIPIPIKKGGGKAIFRRATEKGMAEGKGMHPGIRPMRFVEWGLSRLKYERLPDIARDVSISLIMDRN